MFPSSVPGCDSAFILKVSCTSKQRKDKIYTETVNKVALSANDDKRIILDDKINTLSYGHYKVE